MEYLGHLTLPNQGNWIKLDRRKFCGVKRIWKIVVKSDCQALGGGDI